MPPTPAAPLPSRAAARRGETLLARLARGETRAAITFAGQGTPVLDELAALAREHAPLRPWLLAAEERMQRWYAAREFRWSGLVGPGFALGRWLAEPQSRPEAAALQSTLITNPLIFVAQVARYHALCEEGLGAAFEGDAITGLTGHSQGIMPALLVAESRGGRVSLDRFLRYLDYMAWQGLTMSLSYQGRAREAGETAMAAISGPSTEEVAEAIRAFDAQLPPEQQVFLTLENTRTRNVLSGPPASLARLRAALEARAAREAALRKEGRRGGRPFAFTWESLAVGGPFHSPFMADGLVRMREVVTELGFRVEAGTLALPVYSPVDGARWDRVEDLTEALMVAQFLRPVRWPAAVSAAAAGADWVLDLGPGDGVARLSRSALRGTGARVLALSTGDAAPAADRAVLFSEGAPEPARPVVWAELGPWLRALPQGGVAVQNRFVEATGMPPVLLPGMTPTTVDPAIVAAAANAGYWAEWAGGGQVTEAQFWSRLERLAGMLEPGREVVFNALFLDPYLWGLHLGRSALVQRARRLGLPLGGVIVSAGVPEPAAAVDLLDELAGLGMRWNGFKPGTLAQIDQVATIAERAPKHRIFVQIEGGKAGGHHSWEDLEGLLLERYGRLRELPNVVLCAGGGIGTEARAVALLDGSWSRRHGALPMPVDAIFLGTLAMACKEATASPAVKAALVAAGGTPDWVPSGAVRGGVTSGRSQLGADIHYLENAAARAGRLLDLLAGDAAQVEARRDEIIAALNQTAKPYFGDVGAMSWRELITRAVTLMAIGRGGPEEDGPWPDRSYRERVAMLVRRAEARLASAPRESVLDAGLRALDRPHDIIAALQACYSEFDTRRVSPADARWFVARVCQRPGKPVNFVPVIDQDLRRWYKADSLWQAQDDRYDADQVLIIPGPEAVGGIRAADEPVASLLDRFRDALVAALPAPNGHRPGRPPLPPELELSRHGAELTVRVLARPDHGRSWLDALCHHAQGPLAALLGAERVSVGSRRVPNPLRALLVAEAGAGLRMVDDDHGRLVLIEYTPAGGGEQAKIALDGACIVVDLVIPGTLGAPLRLTLEAAERGPDEYILRMDPEVERDALRRFYLRTLFGSGAGPVALFERAVERVRVDGGLLGAYAALTGPEAGPAPLGMAFSLVFGAIFRTLCADELAGGLLRLVHLDNDIEVGPGWPIRPGAHLEASARVTRVEDAEAGRTVTVRSELREHEGGRPVASLRSRFFLRAGGSERYDRGPWRLRVREPLRATLALPTEAEIAFLAGHDWIGLERRPTQGMLEIEAEIAEDWPREGLPRLRAEGRLLQRGEPLGRVQLEREAALNVHPLLALCELLAAPAAAPGGRRRALARARDRAPASLQTFAEVSGDRNPIHRSALAARLAGLDGPIVHGMWTAARLASHLGGSSITMLHARFLAPLLPGEPLELESARTHLEGGLTVVEGTASAVRGEERVAVVQARAAVRPPRTAVVFPGQGVQQKGMGMASLARSPAAAAVWAEADRLTRGRLGFSILEVVRENPRELHADGRRFLHPEGVLHLTAFTQVALAVLAQAQVAELREAGALLPADDPELLGAGHSLGEYNALGALFGTLPLSTVVEAVWARGLTMHGLVPRDARGESGYRMGVIRPHAAGLDHAGAEALVAAVRERTGAFLAIVNYNVRGRQYAVTGEKAAIEALVELLSARARDPKRAPWQEVPGIDVPFHSAVLASGAPAFREVLERVFPADLRWERLVGRYVPNLVARPFSLERAFVAEVAERGGSAALRAHLDGSAPLTDGALARELLVELLAWQFCSPVRWIETQELLFRPAASGGLGVGRLLEVGPGTSPVLTNMARHTLEGLGPAAPTLELWHAEADRERVCALDEEEAGAQAAPAAATGPGTAEAAAPAARVTAAPAPARAAGESVPDRPISVGEAVRALLALGAKVRPEQLREAETIDELFDGVSSRRNQALLDLGAELGVSGLDGAQERPLSALLVELDQKGGRYRGPGKVLRAAGDEAIKRLLGRHQLGRKEVAAWLDERWGLGAGWAEAVILHLALESREGASARGGDLGALRAAPDSREAARALVDAAAEAVGRQRGVALARADLATGAAAVDPAAVAALEQRLLGPDGALGRAARALAEGTGQVIQAPGLRPPAAEDAAAARLATLERELGAPWLELIQPLFDARRHVVFESSWANARRDLAALVFRAANGERAGLEAELSRLARHAEDPVLLATARWYASAARARGDQGLAEALDAFGPARPALALTPSRPRLELGRDGALLYRELPDEGGLAGFVERALPRLGLDRAGDRFAEALRALTREPLQAGGRVALITGASPGSIALELARQLLWGGATVVLTSSSLDDRRVRFYRRLFQRDAGPGAALHLLPCNQGSLDDVGRLLAWLGERGLVPDLLVPFAAIKESGSLGEDLSRAAAALRVQLLGVEALVAGVARQSRRERPCQVLLPLSPNHGAFGGDGAYAETKAALEVLLEKVHSEREAWGARVALVGARIGWVRGTGLMDANNPLAPRLEAETGLLTFSAAEMGLLLAALSAPPLWEAAAEAPIRADLAAGFDGVRDLRGVVGKIRAELAAESARARREAELAAREAERLGRPPAPPLVLPLPELAPAAPSPAPWPAVQVPLDEVVVVVGAGELGPWGSARTRFEIEVEDRLSPAGVLELAWMTGLIKPDAEGGWLDAASGEPVPEESLAERYREAVTTASGIRWIEPSMAGYDPARLPVMAKAWLDRDLSFPVGSREEAESFLAADPAHTSLAQDEAGGWVVTRRAGSEIRVPRVWRIDRQVAGLLPTGFDPVRYGIPAELAAGTDRVGLMNLAATADAFLSAGLTPEELMAAVHPARVANTQGSGLGGGRSLRRLNTDALLGEARQLDALQETLINVAAAHVVQSFVGSYGPMAHPVGACATAAVSLEEGIDKILLGKADVVIAGGYDDISAEGAVGFLDMAATASSDEMAAMGIGPRAMSRPNDRRRHGFVEAHGGGTLILARGSVALELGLPVLGVLGWAGSFGDGLHRSIPAPGLGALAAGLGGAQSPLGRALARWGLGADDVALVYKHDTSTNANDVNENRLHHALQQSLGRTPGNPLFAVSQKAITGHAKGGSAAWQAIGLLQALAAGVIPGNPNLESVDEAMRAFDTMAFTDGALRPGPALPLRAGLLTSLGFGHVSAMCLLLHPDAFLAAIPEERREAWRAAAARRLEQGRLGLLAAMRGERGVYARRNGRRLPHADGGEAQLEAEIALLRDPEARLDPQSGLYRAGAR